MSARRDDGECIGCFEAGLFEVLRSLVLEERAAAGPTRGGETQPPLRPECTPR
jgi:hypothetical protein